MNKELLYTFFQGKTTLDEEVRIREWMESSPENYRTFLEERKLFDAMILLTNCLNWFRLDNRRFSSASSIMASNSFLSSKKVR